MDASNMTVTRQLTIIEQLKREARMKRLNISYTTNAMLKYCQVNIAITWKALSIHVEHLNNCKNFIDNWLHLYQNRTTMKRIIWFHKWASMSSEKENKNPVCSFRKIERRQRTLRKLMNNWYSQHFHIQLCIWRQLLSQYLWKSITITFVQYKNRLKSFSVCWTATSSRLGVIKQSYILSMLTKSYYLKYTQKKSIMLKLAGPSLHGIKCNQQLNQHSKRNTITSLMNVL